MANPTQYISFYISVFFLIVSILQMFLSKREAKWIYLFASFGWIASIVFYAKILFYGWGGGHEWSPDLRLFQYMMFGGWMFFTLCEATYKRFFRSEKYKIIKDKVVKTWQQASKQ